MAFRLKPCPFRPHHKTTGGRAVLHQRVTDALAKRFADFTAYNVMRLLHELHVERARPALGN